MALKCDAVFEGGGVKGIGFAGAISALERRGYQFQNVVGTSAGAIAACLVAAGYTGEELERELLQVDYRKFRQKGRFEIVGLFQLVSTLGLYKSDAFEQWLDGLLARKGKRVFGDIKTGFRNPKYRYKFQATASDLTGYRLLVLPGDLEELGIDPDSFPLSKAVQMSMSIPFFYRPVKLTDRAGKTHFIADGGLLSNYPVWLLDDGTSDPPWPTFGFKFTADDETQGRRARVIRSLPSYTRAVISTMLEAHDKYHISNSKGDFARSILIPTKININGKETVIRTTDFGITEQQSRKLYQNGLLSTNQFLENWNFQNWKQTYRETTNN